MVIFAGRELPAGADHEVAAHRVQALTLVQLPGDPGALCRVGAVAKDEVGPHMLSRSRTPGCARSGMA